MVAIKKKGGEEKAMRDIVKITKNLKPNNR